LLNTQVDMVVFQALNWVSQDVDDEHLISIFGRTLEGKSVCVTTCFPPYFFLRLSTKSPSVVFDKIKNFADSYNVLNCKDLWGFQNNEKRPFMKLNFTTLTNMRACDRKLKYPLPGETHPYKVYESNLDPILRFMHRTKIQSTGWIDTGDNCILNNLCKTDIDIFCNRWADLKPSENNEMAPFIVASFDIEANSSTGKFPDPEIHGDCVFQIAITLKRLGNDEIYDKTCLCYKTTNSIEGNNIISYPTEYELLMGFKKYLEQMDIDIMTGWNIFGFDLEFIYKRALLAGCPSEFFELSKFKNYECEIQYKKLSSSALGDNTMKIIPMPGRFIFDLFHEVKKSEKLDSYTLNYVSETLLGDKKIDMAPKEMFKRFVEEDPAKLSEVAEYCIKDTLLPHYLMDKLCTLLNLIEMAKATWVPITYLCERGQQIKVFSQVTRKARELGFMVPTIRWGSSPQQEYEGATVLEAQTGAYYEPITALDFEGLYPSIMMAHNLCYSTLVLESKYDNIPGINYESFVIDNKTYKFAQDVPSLLPLILSELKQFRKQAKKDMAQATGQMKQMFNGKQLAYKVSMNSVYGFTGASKGMLPCVAIAATVTCEGRHMIEQTKELVEEEFPGAKVRYGDTDSVMVEFDVQGRTGLDAIEYSWKLGEQAAAKCKALFKSPKNLELEKVYYPYILYSKKRYAAKMWTQGRDGKMQMDCIDVKGLQLVRRDNIPYVREVSREILDIILDSKNPEAAKNLAHDRAVQLLDGQIPIEKLTLSQKLAESYKSNNLPHVRVRDKIRKRSPGSEPQSGDRVQFVLVKTSEPTSKQFEKSEDPKWVVENNLALDYPYYFLHKFMTPVCDLLEPLIANPREMLFGDLLPPPKRKKKEDVKCKKIDDLFLAYNNKFKREIP
jgi:DNA polymerase delta subunit 1